MFTNKLRKSGKLMAMLCLLLIGMMLVSSCTVSSNGKSTGTITETDNNGVKSKEEEPSGTKHLNLVWMGYTEPGFSAIQNTEVQKIVEGEFNVTIELLEIDCHNQEQVSLLLAGGTYPDAIIGSPSTLMKQGVIRPISESMLYKNMPSWMKITEELVTKEFLQQQLPIEGKIWGIPYASFANYVTRLGVLRKDWLDNVGIKKLPETVDEMGEVLRAFTFDDPDKNGKDDTYGWHLLTTGYVYWGHYLMGAFGIQPDSYYVENDKVFYTSTTEEYKEALKVLNKWYMEGYIDPEFITDTRDVQRSKWSEGMFGYIEDAAGWVSSGLMATNLQSMVLEKNPSAEFIVLPAFKGPKGKHGGRMNFPNIQSGNSYCFGVNTSDEKVERIMQIYERCASEWDWYMRMTYGVEGEHWNYNSDGVMELNPDITIEKRSELGLRLFSGFAPLGFEAMPKLYTKEAQKGFQIAIDNPKSYWGVSIFLDKNNQTLLDNSATLSTIMQEFTIDAVTGNKNIDAEWDQFVQTFMKAGGEQVIKELQDTYNKQK